MEIETIITIVISIVALVAGGFWLKAKGKLADIVALLKEAKDVITAVQTALADDKISKEEKEAIKKEYDELVGALKQLISW